MEAGIITYGATVVSLKTADRQGKFADVVLGVNDLAGYLKQTAYFGATVGRYANRIAHGRFKLNGVEYRLPKNNGDNTLHGGPQGFARRIWGAKEAGESLELLYLSHDGEEGFPGNVSVTTRFTVTRDNELKIEYTATTDHDTVINLTNHSYFNLKGRGQGDILQHQVQIDAGRFTPVDSGLIPTGELRPVKGTVFDFTTPHAIGERIERDDEQLRVGKGYDHNFVLNRSGRLAKAAEVHEASAGRIMEVWTTEPGIQFYTGNVLREPGYAPHSGYCMETQHFPDSPNHPEFPSTMLKADQTYRSTTAYKFSAR